MERLVDHAERLRVPCHIEQLLIRAYGYAMVKVDARGVSQTPGARWAPGEITKDFYDAVEWAAEQNWSNGKVALVGSSYGANIQWNVASLRPKGLECFVPYASKHQLWFPETRDMADNSQLTWTRIARRPLPEVSRQFGIWRIGSIACNRRPQGGKTTWTCFPS